MVGVVAPCREMLDETSLLYIRTACTPSLSGFVGAAIWRTLLFIVSSFYACIGFRHHLIPHGPHLLSTFSTLFTFSPSKAKYRRTTIICRLHVYRTIPDVRGRKYVLYAFFWLVLADGCLSIVTISFYMRCTSGGTSSPSNVLVEATILRASRPPSLANVLSSVRPVPI